MGRPRKFDKLSANAAAVIANSTSAQAAATTLRVDATTIRRWIEAGRVPSPVWATGPRKRTGRGTSPAASAAAAWARWVRHKYVLSRDEAQLLKLAQMTLEMAGDKSAPRRDRIAASVEYRRLRNELKLPPEEVLSGDIAKTADIRAWPRRVR